MAYRNGTYIAFHANGTTVPTDSDIKYYNLMKEWTAKTDDDFTMVNSHEKTSAVRDTSKKETLKKSLQERLRNSKNMLLIISDITRLDTDWVPFEIQQAVDVYKIPLIIAYVDRPYCITDGSNAYLPKAYKQLWPKVLADRIDNQTAHAIHIPFKEKPIACAINQFSPSIYPKSGGLGYYNRETYVNWGLLN
jgi:hypothetical protein